MRKEDKIQQNIYALKSVQFYSLKYLYNTHIA